MAEGLVPEDFGGDIQVAISFVQHSPKPTFCHRSFPYPPLGAPGFRSSRRPSSLRFCPSICGRRRKERDLDQADLAGLRATRKGPVEGLVIESRTLQGKG